MIHTAKKVKFIFLKQITRYYGHKIKRLNGQTSYVILAPVDDDSELPLWSSAIA